MFAYTSAASKIDLEIRLLKSEAAAFSSQTIAHVNERAAYGRQAADFCTELREQAETGRISAQEAVWKARVMREQIRHARELASSEELERAPLLDHRQSHFLSPGGRTLSERTLKHALDRLRRPEEIAGRGSRTPASESRLEDPGGEEPAAEEKPEKRLTIFANGYIISQQLDAMDLVMIGQAPVVVYTEPYPPPIEVMRSDPVYDGEHYWGPAEGFFKLGFKDYNAVFFNGSNFHDSQADDRMRRGALAARKLDEEVRAGSIKFEPPGEVKIVGHSQGAAYAAGMAQALLGMGYHIIAMWYLAPHQPGDISHPAGIPAMQMSRRSDKVSTVGLARHKKLSGGSELKPIPGVANFQLLEDMDMGRGGHSVFTYTAAVRTYYEENGKSLLLN